MCVQCIYCLSMYSTLATPIKRPLLSRSGPPLLPATQQHCSVEEEHNSKAVSQSWRQLMGVHNSHTYNPRHTQTPCCTATPVAVCLSVLLAEGPTWVDGSISLDAPWNCGPQCAAITRHTRGTHTHTEQHKASLKGSNRRGLLLQPNLQAAWQRQKYMCLLSQQLCPAPLFGPHRRQRTAHYTLVFMRPLTPAHSKQHGNPAKVELWPANPCCIGLCVCLCRQAG